MTTAFRKLIPFPWPECLERWVGIKKKMLKHSWQASGTIITPWKLCSASEFTCPKAVWLFLGLVFIAEGINVYPSFPALSISRVNFFFFFGPESNVSPWEYLHDSPTRIKYSLLCAFQEGMTLHLESYLSLGFPEICQYIPTLLSAELGAQ